MNDTNILIIDDEAEFLSALQERLSLRGFSVKGAINGDLALKMLQLEEFTVAIMDVKMPGISGAELLNRIKELRPGIKVILITGYGATDVEEEDFIHDAFCVFSKPINLNELVGKIKE